MIKLRCLKTEKLYELLKDFHLKESQYWIETKKYPDTQDLVKSNERDETVIYMQEICNREDVSFSIETFGLSVSLLDRFLASFKVKTKYLECLALTCLYIASKVKEENENILNSVNFLKACDAKFSISELFRMELMILSKLDWSINDVTAIDFIHLYYALLVDKHRLIESSETKHFKLSKVCKWQKMSYEKTAINQEKQYSAYPPHNLDFLHIVEKKLRHCLCANELATNFKPHVLAFSLISLQIEKDFDHIEDDDMYLNNSVIKNAMLEMINVTLISYSKLDIEIVNKCKEQIQSHLASTETTRIFFDRYYFNMLKLYRSSSIFMTPLSSLNTQLSVIKEEDEEDNESVISKKFEKSLFNENLLGSSMQVCMGHHDTSVDKNIWTNVSYAEILSGKCDQKRKLSENLTSDGEDSEFEYEN